MIHCDFCARRHTNPTITLCASRCRCQIVDWRNTCFVRLFYIIHIVVSRALPGFALQTTRHIMATPPAASLRDALRAEPGRLQTELTSVLADIQRTSLENFAVHVANWKTDADVRETVSRRAVRGG